MAESSVYVLPVQVVGPLRRFHVFPTLSLRLLMKTVCGAVVTGHDGWVDTKATRVKAPTELNAAVVCVGCGLPLTSIGNSVPSLRKPCLFCYREHRCGHCAHEHRNAFRVRAGVHRRPHPPRSRASTSAAISRAPRATDTFAWNRDVRVPDGGLAACDLDPFRAVASDRARDLFCV